jgi:hypothetical protein
VISMGRLTSPLAEWVKEHNKNLVKAGLPSCAEPADPMGFAALNASYRLPLARTVILLDLGCVV